MRCLRLSRRVGPTTKELGLTTFTTVLLRPTCARFCFFAKKRFFCVFRGPGAVKQEKTSRNAETNSKINFIFGARKIIVYYSCKHLGKIASSARSARSGSCNGVSAAARSAPLAISGQGLLAGVHNRHDSMMIIVLVIVVFAS